MADEFQRRTRKFLRQLHAREMMRLGCYRQWSFAGSHVRTLRERKSRHEAFLRDLLRRRGFSPAWYSRLFYLSGHAIGWFSAFFPEKWVDGIEKTFEFWILIRYQDYLKKLRLDFNLRSMFESVRLERLAHAEPGNDVISLIENHISAQEAPFANPKLS